MSEPIGPDDLSHLFADAQEYLSPTPPPAQEIRDRAAALRRGRVHRRTAMGVAGAAAAAVVAIVVAVNVVETPGGKGTPGGTVAASTSEQTLAPGPTPTTESSTQPSASANAVTEPSATAASRPLPITVQSDSQMKAAGNYGPTSSILIPDTCIVSGTTVTATGHYDGRSAPPEVYLRVGAMIDLYVFGPAISGYPDGVQIASLSYKDAPAIANPGPWTVTVPVDLSTWQPARCVVASQPTHDIELAGNNY